MVDEQARREAAIGRLKEKRDFWSHVIAYVVVNAFLVVVWGVANSGGNFWPIWPIGGWGIGLLIHAWETFRPRISEKAIQKEMQKGD
jgi:hypothetical protein